MISAVWHISRKRGFWLFPKISDHFPKIFQKCFEGQMIVPEHFPKISEDYRKFSRKTRRYFDHTSTNSSTILKTNLISVKSSISSLVMSRITKTLLNVISFAHITCLLIPFAQFASYPFIDWKRVRDLRMACNSIKGELPQIITFFQTKLVALVFASSLVWTKG